MRMSGMRRAFAAVGAVWVAWAWACGPALGQVSRPPVDARQGPMGIRPIDPQTPEGRALLEYRRRVREVTQELRRIRFEHFGSMRNVEIRQAGIARLRGYTEPAAYPALLEVFERDGDDVRGAVLDHLATQQNEAADTALAWAAVFGRDRGLRSMAADRLRARLGEDNSAGASVRTVIAQGLARTNNDQVSAAAQLAAGLGIIEAIPMLINAQVVSGVGGSGSGGDPGTSLAYIYVGQQQAFVADLTPVVSDNAVAFDPQLGVLTTGVVLRVIDAATVTYRVDVHNALVDLTSRAWGRPTGPLGWNQRAWHRWYREEFVPEMERRRVEAGGGG